MDSGTQELTCRICGSATIPIGAKRGKFLQREFLLRHCPECRFSFVADPWTDYAAIYSADYYSGRGADPLVDYLFELEQPGRTIRRYEWQGILRAVQSLTRVDATTQWLDFGCGNGGLVRHLREHGVPLAVGFEEGWIVGKARDAGIPILSRRALRPLAGKMDVVSAIEVLEHVERPLEALRQIREMLRPGGLLFLTTGDAQRVRGNLADWSYVTPEIHISFFEPHTLARAFRDCGLEPAFRGFLPGFSDIIRFKALKNVGVRECSGWQSLIPWALVSRLLDARFGVTGHPIGRAI